jgi:hypothetical protein
MKYFLKNLGLLMIIAAVIMLAVYAKNNLIANTYLIVSLILLVFGIVVHIFTNKTIQ